MAWGIPGALSSVFNIDQNPLGGVITVGVQESQPNLNPNILATLGARVTEYDFDPVATTDIRCMTPYLSISETEPVTTDLELYYDVPDKRFAPGHRILISFQEPEDQEIYNYYEYK